MSTLRNLTLAAVAMGSSFTAWAVPMSNPTLSAGISTVFLVSAPGTLTPVPGGSVATALTGNASDPTGNIELGRFGSSPATVLSGDFGGNSISLSSLTLADWTANSNALTRQYITDAAAAIGTSLNAGQLSSAEFVFLNILVSGIKPYQYVSDPNVSYVDMDNGMINIGLAGLLDASNFLKVIDSSAPAGSQASEVVKVTYNGNTQYLYSFSATPSGYGLGSPTNPTFSGNYEVSIRAAAVPLPATLWLMGVGFAALMASRRNQRAAA